MNEEVFNDRILFCFLFYDELTIHWIDKNNFKYVIEVVISYAILQNFETNAPDETIYKQNAFAMTIQWSYAKSSALMLQLPHCHD